MCAALVLLVCRTAICLLNRRRGLDKLMMQVKFDIRPLRVQIPTGVGPEWDLREYSRPRTIDQVGELS